MGVSDYMIFKHKQNSHSPAAGDVHVILPPAQSGLGVAVYLTPELHALVHQDHLVHGPLRKRRPLWMLCGGETNFISNAFLTEWWRGDVLPGCAATGSDLFLFWGQTGCVGGGEAGGGIISCFLPKMESCAFSLFLSPTMLAATHTYIPESVFFVFEIVSFPPRTCNTATQGDNKKKQRSTIFRETGSIQTAFQLFQVNVIREKHWRCDLELRTGLDGGVGDWGAACWGGGWWWGTLTVILSSLRSSRASSFLQKVVGSGWPRGGWHSKLAVSPTATTASWGFCLKSSRSTETNY